MTRFTIKMTRREAIKKGGLALTASTLPFVLTAFTKNRTMENNSNFEVIIIGGSYAGLSAAMALGRSLRKVLLIDGGKPCNIQTPHSHNFITQDGEKPDAIAKKAKAQVLQYDTVEFLDDLATSGTKTEDGFTIATKSGGIFTAKKLILATGIKDLMPDIEGFSECWGISVIHCPYCHGYEFRNQRTAIMANGDRAFHLASLVHNLTKDIVILTSGTATFTPDQTARLNKNGIRIIETAPSAIGHIDGQVKNVVLSDGTKISLDAVYASIPFVQHSDIPTTLGCRLTDTGHIEVDPFQKTNTHGIYACGDNTSMMRSVANAVYTGNLTGAMVNKELTDEQF